MKLKQNNLLIKEFYQSTSYSLKEFRAMMYNGVDAYRNLRIGDSDSIDDKLMISS